MDLPIENLLRRTGVEYLTLNGALRITGVSEGAARLADHPSSVCVGNDVRMSFPELVGAEDDLRAVLDARRASYVIRAVCRSNRPGAPLYISLTVELRRGDQTQEPALLVTLEDVSGWMNEVQKTTQTSNEAALLIHAMTASKAYIENIFDAMADVLIVTSPDGTINAVNRAALALSEYTMAEIVGRPITELLPEESPEGQSSNKSRFTNAELRCITKSGKMIPVSFSRAPLSTDETVVHGVVYIGRDLRERKEAEERISKLETEKHSLQEAFITSQETPDIIGSSPIMKNLMKDVGKVASTDTTVFITGETGTGKELIARAIHQMSSRRESLLVNVNCAALPAGLVESELFGHEKGSFTGAVHRRIGRFELADGGTVFLDEVGELPLATQATLLRVLQEQAFERVGGSQTVTVNVRIIAATNRDLAEEVNKGRFREELLFRLNVFPLHVPPLRERLEDIPLLAEYFIRLFTRRTNKQVTSLSHGAMRTLTRYSWPGNVRELANVIERAMIVCEGTVLQEADFALVDLFRKNEDQTATFDEMARQHLMHTLEECGGIIEGPRGAAARLGLKPATLRSRMKKLGLSRTRGRFVKTA